MATDAPVNAGAPSGPAPAGPTGRVSRMQATLHRWAAADPGRRFDDLRQRLWAGEFRPMPVRERMIPKPGGGKKMRRSGIPTVADRVVQAALKLLPRRRRHRLRGAADARRQGRQGPAGRDSFKLLIAHYRDERSIPPEIADHWPWRTQLAAALLRLQALPPPQWI